MRDLRFKWIPATLVSAIAVTVPPRAAESAESPRLVVPDVRDTTIKTRRTFASSNINLINDDLRGLRSSGSPPPRSSGAFVNVTIDVVDTGEWRQLGYHVARHVITTTKTDAAPDANARSGVVIQDAWYID